jgi:hypothetical protein
MSDERPTGNFAILELFGHTTLVGRYAEVEMFGTKMLAMEPLFNDTLLPVVFHGGSAIYRLTPCSVDVAYDKQPRHGYQLPPSIKAIVPQVMIAAELVAERGCAPYVYDDHDGAIDTNTGEILS